MNKKHSLDIPFYHHQLKTEQNIWNTSFHTLDNRQDRIVISERGETNEVTSMLVQAFYLEIFSKAVAQLGKLNKKHWVEKTELGIKCQHGWNSWVILLERKELFKERDPEFCMVFTWLFGWLPVCACLEGNSIKLDKEQHLVKEYYRKSVNQTIPRAHTSPGIIQVLIIQSGQTP